LRKCRPTLLCRHPIPPFRSTIDPKGMPVAWRGQVGRPGREARPTHPDRGTPLLGQDDVRRLHALRALLGRVLDLRTLRPLLETAAADARVMHKQVLTTLVRSDEPITLLVAKPLDGSGCHRNSSPASERTRKGGARHDHYSFSLSTRKLSQAD